MFFSIKDRKRSRPSVQNARDTAKRFSTINNLHYTHIIIEQVEICGQERCAPKMLLNLSFTHDSYLPH
jgi:hypothetical protein